MLRGRLPRAALNSPRGTGEAPSCAGKKDDLARTLYLARSRTPAGRVKKNTIATGADPNMSTNGALNRKLRMGLVGGGQGAFIGRVHCTAAVLDNRAALVAGALSSRSRKGQGLGRRLRHSARAGLRLVQEMIAARNEAARRRAHRLRLRRHAEPHALRDRQGRARGRLQRHVRQADDVRPGAGRGAGQGRRRARASSSP